jgi:hypothetical protein
MVVAVGPWSRHALVMTIRSRAFRLLLLTCSLVLVLGACGSAGSTASEATPTGDAAPTGRCDWQFNTVSFWNQYPPAEETGAHDHMGNAHGVQAWQPMDDWQDCARFQRQLDTMDEVIERYPTAQVALDAGCYRATIYIPGIAAHYVCTDNLSEDAVLDKPLMLLYGGSAPTAPIVGLSYMVYSDGPPNEQPDAPLWARYMPWHFHEGLCVDDAGLVIGGDQSDPGSCEARGGQVQGKTGWMGHYWPKNCPSPDGVFSSDNPRLDWTVGQFNDSPDNAPKTDELVAAPCQGSTMVIDPSGDDRFGKPVGYDDGTTAGDGHDHEHPESESASD